MATIQQQRLTDPQMRIDEELAQLSPERESVLIIGVFDGVHRGHRHLVDSLLREAEETKRLAGVVTFRNHPASVLRPDFKSQNLTALDERLQLIQEMGVDFVLPITFDLDLSKLRVKDFIGLLQRHLRMRGVVMGPDFAMGHQREGDVETLRRLGEEMGFSIRVVDVLVDDGVPVRSTTIRKALDTGNVPQAAKLLGRSFALMGKVVKGAGRGSALGFPTANLEVPPEMAVPGNGIYAAWAHAGRGRLMAAASIGTRPTFDEEERTIEAFILDFDDDLYDQEIRLEFVQRLRDEVRYDSTQELKDQMARDVDQTRSILQESHTESAQARTSSA